MSEPTTPKQSTLSCTALSSARSVPHSEHTQPTQKGAAIINNTFQILYPIYVVTYKQIYQK